jgi:voltage-gated potassium channel
VAIITANTTTRRRRWYHVLEDGVSGGTLARWVAVSLVALVVGNITVIVLDTVPAISARHGDLFRAIEILSLLVFGFEYVARMWVAPEAAVYRGMSAARARLSHATKPLSIIDLLAVFPLLSVLAHTDTTDLLLLRVFTLVRFLKLARYSSSLASIGNALHAERRALFATAVVMSGVLLMSATAMYAIERHAQPDAFGSIPAALWWAVVTLGTVGYGDVVPITPLGKFVASFVIFLGIGMFGLPIGIIATAFVRELERREFVVTWSLVARVPIFEDLSASEIADLTALLEAHAFEPGATVCRRGEPAEAMYFIATGEVEILLAKGPVTLHAGAFFGEVALLRKTTRTATVRAVAATRLLSLGAHDFAMLLERRPDIARRIHDVAGSRVEGDLLREELSDPGAGPT